MANLFDYLEWRGDIPFSIDPFNEVDNLILSELAYLSYRDIVPRTIPRSRSERSARPFLPGMSARSFLK